MSHEQIWDRVVVVDVLPLRQTTQSDRIASKMSINLSNRRDCASLPHVSLTMNESFFFKFLGTAF